MADPVRVTGPATPPKAAPAFVVNAAPDARSTADGGPAADKRPAFELLLQIEAEARRAPTVGELAFLIANETLRLSRVRQIFVLAARGSDFRIASVSSIGEVDRNGLRILWIESVVAALAADVGLAAAHEFSLPAYGGADPAEAGSYPFRYLRWFPFALRDGHVFAGMLIAREMPWNEADVVVTARLADTYAHAWGALAGPKRLKRRLTVKPTLAAAAVGAAILAVFPVSLTVLSPTEVVAIGPRIVAAPLDGVVREIRVEPNQTVAEGDILLTMADTVLRNELAVAERDVNVASAGLKRISQAAVSDPKMRSDLALSRTELELATAKRDYARDLFERSTVRAPSTGIAVYTEKRDWIGRPVSTGERIMEIADPARLELRIDVPVADAIALGVGARVRAFLDSDPLHPVTASLRSVSFEARRIEDNTLAYRSYALVEDPGTAMRLGVHGTAQVAGNKVPLAFYLFRRPVAAIRQWIGL